MILSKARIIARLSRSDGASSSLQMNTLLLCDEKTSSVIDSLGRRHSRDNRLSVCPRVWVQATKTYVATSNEYYDTSSGGRSGARYLVNVDCSGQNVIPDSQVHWNGHYESE